MQGEQQHRHVADIADRLAITTGHDSIFAQSVIDCANEGAVNEMLQ